jgi:hypothetical protein
MDPMMQGLDPEAMMGGPKPLKTDPHDGETAPREPFNPSEDGGRRASPEEQEVYEKFVAASMMVLWDRKSATKYAQALRTSPEPKETAAEIAAQIGFRVLKGAADAGSPLPGHIVLAGGMEIATQVGEMAEKSGVKMTPQDVEQVYYMALDKGRVMAQKAGLIDQDMVSRDAAMLDKMGQDGRLDQAMSLVDADHKRTFERQALPDDDRSSFDTDDDTPVSKSPAAKPGGKIALDPEED